LSRSDRRRRRSSRDILGLVVLLASTASACASSSQSTEATLAPLDGAPTTLALDTDPVVPGPSSSSPGATIGSTPGESTTTPSALSTAPPAAPIGDWGAWPYYEVPQLGTEPVRGSGCGANGGLGDTVPDGVWNVLVGDGSGADRFWSGDSIEVDVRCVYAGDAGQAQWNLVCSGAPSAAVCQSQSPTWFVVNANSRLRTMPVAASVQYGVGALGTSPCPSASTDRTAGDAAWRFMDSWIVVRGGQVTTVVAACPAG
jgi:hypothetical protein